MHKQPSSLDSRPAAVLYPLFSALVAVVLFSSITAQAAGNDRPVARVNGVTINQSDLSCAVEASLAQQLGSGQVDIRDGDEGERGSGDDETLERLITIELLYQESLKHRFHGLLEESRERYQLEVRRLGGEERLASALQCNNMSPEQFQKAIFRNLSIKRFLNKVVYSKIHVTEEDVKAYYDQNRDRFMKPESVRLRHILIKAPRRHEEEKWRQAEERAYAIYREASTGMDFVRLARRHSDDPVSASVGGDIGAIERGSLESRMDSLLFAMEAGSVTEPIRSIQGFHIFKVVSTTPSRTVPFEEVRQRIVTQLRRELARTMISDLLSQLESRAQIEILPR